MDDTNVCTCQRGSRNLTCRCTCPACGSTDLVWEKWGVYLDKDLVCQSCQHVVDYWDC